MGCSCVLSFCLSRFQFFGTLLILQYSAAIVVEIEIGKGAFVSVTLGSDTSALGKQLMRPGTQSTSHLESNRTFPLNDDLKDICSD